MRDDDRGSAGSGIVGILSTWLENAFDSQARIISMQRAKEPQANPERRAVSELSAEELRILLAQAER